MRRFSVFSMWFVALLLSNSVIGQTPQTQQDPQPQRPRGVRQRAFQKSGFHGGKRLQRMDANNDGMISREEWQGNPKAFDRLDKNKDGVISREEIAVRGGSQRMGRIRQLDQNNDKQISRDEWKGSAETFNRLDINSDGVITKEELRALRQNRRRRFNK